MKTKGSFARTICIWIVTVLLVTIFAGGTSALICRKQIGEAIAYHQSEESLEKSNDKETALPMQEKNFHKEKEHDFADKLAVLGKFSPLNTSQKAALILLAAFWLAVILLYWFSVTSMLAERAELIKFNRHIWFWLAFFTNIIAVILFSVIKKIFVKKCSKCGNYQTGGAYCTACGNALEIRCTQCGKILKTNVEYCPQCGKKA